jgi:hypothetical protein
MVSKYTVSVGEREDHMCIYISTAGLSLRSHRMELDRLLTGRALPSAEKGRLMLRRLMKKPHLLGSEIILCRGCDRPVALGLSDPLSLKYLAVTVQRIDFKDLGRAVEFQSWLGH